MTISTAKPLQLSAFAVLMVAILQPVAHSQEAASIAKAVYSEMEADRLLKIVDNLIGEKKLGEAGKILSVLEQSRDDTVLFEVAKIRYRRLDSLQKTSTAVRILSKLTDKKSALRGKAAFELARLYRTNPKLQKQDLMLETLLLAAQSGYAKAYPEIAYLYTTGTGVAKNTRTALHYYQLAARHDSVASIVSFARYLQRKPDENQCGISPVELVASYYPKLVTEATSGHPAAAKELARLHVEGTLKPRSIDKARIWLRQAVIGGDIGALRDLALLELASGNDESNLQRSLRMLKDAAAAGNSAALTTLGRLEQKLQITIPDDRLALGNGTYFEKSAAAGNRRAVVEMARSMATQPANGNKLTRFSEVTRLARWNGVNLAILNFAPGSHPLQLADISSVDQLTTGSVGPKASATSSTGNFCQAPAADPDP